MLEALETPVLGQPIEEGSSRVFGVAHAELVEAFRLLKSAKQPKSSLDQRRRLIQVA